MIKTDRLETTVFYILITCCSSIVEDGACFMHITQMATGGI